MRKLLIIGVIALGFVGLAAAALPQSLLDALNSVNNSNNQMGSFDDRQKVYNQQVYSALQQLDARVSALEGTPTTSVTYITPISGATVSGVTDVRVLVPPATDWIGIHACGGLSVGEDSTADPDGSYMVRWDTTICPNGETSLDTWAYLNNGTRLGNAELPVTVNNESIPPDPVPVECSDSNAPISGYTLTFSDCFDTLSRSVWCGNQWWEPAPVFGTQFVQNGILHVQSRRVDGYPNNTITSEPCDQASPKSFKQGYFEARLRWTKGNGSSPAFWLFSTRHATNPAWPSVNPFCTLNGLPVAECYSGEIDVFEGQGHQPSTFIGTVHRNSCGCYGVANQMRQGVPTEDIGVDMTTDFHTYAVHWTATSLNWYLDGKLLGSTQTFDSSNQPMHLLFYQWPQSWTRDPDSTTPAILDTEVDWVKVWQG